MHFLVKGEIFKKIYNIWSLESGHIVVEHINLNLFINKKGMFDKSEYATLLFLAGILELVVYWIGWDIETYKSWSITSILVELQINLSTKNLLASSYRNVLNEAKNE